MESDARNMGSALRRFLASEAIGGFLLIAAAALALIFANGPLADAYHRLLDMRSGPVLTPAIGPMTVHIWINDGLMALFFMLVGLEIKREFLDGRLATWRQRRLPVIAAFMGMIVPAMIYLAIVAPLPELHARLGNPRGDRYRLRGRRSGAARQPGAGFAEAVPNDGRDRRRPRRRRDHRPCLYGPDRPYRPWRRRRNFPRHPCHGEKRRHPFMALSDRRRARFGMRSCCPEFMRRSPVCSLPQPFR